MKKCVKLAVTKNL